MASYKIQYESEDLDKELEGYEPGYDFEESEPEEEQLLEDEDKENDTTHYPFEIDDPLPQPTLLKLILAKDMIDSIRAACLEDDLDKEMLARLWNPPQEPETLDTDTLFSMALFNDLIGGSQQMYHDVWATIKHFTDCELHSYYVVKMKQEKMTRVIQLQTDMCVNSCIAFMGPLKGLDKCPTCNEDHYWENRKTWKLQPPKQFYTIPLGPQLQAMWYSLEGTDCIRYRNRKTDEII